MYSAPPQYIGSTSGLLPSGAPRMDSSIPMQPYPAQQQQGPYYQNTFIASHHDNSQHSFPPISPAPKEDHSNPHQYNAPRSTPAEYPRLKLNTVLIRFLPILIVNIILEALFAYVLKYYGDKKVLMPNDRRLFNMASLFLAAALSMGIGFLLGEVGIMFRGSMMGKSDNTKDEIAHILRGTLGSYALLVLSHVRRKAYTHATTLSWLFVLGNLLGRLSVGLIGLTYVVKDDNLVTVPALEATWWPEVGEAMRNESIFVEPRLVEDGLIKLLREVATVRVPFPEKVKIDMDDKGDGVIKDLGFLEVPEMEMTVENPEGSTGSVKYTYVLQDVGGDPKIRVKRTIEISAECARGKAKYTDKKFSSTTFYPTSTEKAVIGAGSSRYGWLLLSHSETAEECGTSCREFGITEGTNNFEGEVNSRWGTSGVGYTCHISVLYNSPQGWGSRLHVAPSEKLILAFTELLVGNGTHHDLGKSGDLFNDDKIASENSNWLAPWGEIDVRTQLYPQGAGIAGVLARAGALVVQRLGMGLDKHEIEPSKITVAGILSVNWTWVIWVLVGICVVQFLVAFVAGILMLGSLAVEDDLELLDGLIASERFPSMNEAALVPQKPWVKTPTGNGELSYRFKGGAWGTLGADVVDSKRT